MRKQFQLWFRSVAVVMLLATLLLAGCGTASQTTIPPTDSVSIAGEVPSEGIQVHGHWIIEVKNPDGTLAERREFDNALSPMGARALNLILTRGGSVGGWIIELDGVSGTESAFLNSAGTRDKAQIVEFSSTATGPNIFKTLMSTGTLDEMRWTGTATAQAIGGIGVVKTSIVLRSSTVAPVSSYDGTPYLFTFTTLTDVVRLSTGQEVTVSVVIRFS